MWVQCGSGTLVRSELVAKKEILETSLMQKKGFYESMGIGPRGRKGRGTGVVKNG